MPTDRILAGRCDMTLVGRAGLRLRMTDSDSDYAAMVMANYMLGGGITARLPDRIRNREGLSYGVGSNFSAPPEGDAAVFSASAIANPANIAKVEFSFTDELARTLRDGFTAEELATAKQALLDERTGSRSSDRGLLNLTVRLVPAMALLYLAMAALTIKVIAAGPVSRAGPTIS